MGPFDMFRRGARFLRCVLPLLGLGCVPAAAQPVSPTPYGPDDEIAVSYLYAAVMGSGTYSVRDRRITMFRLPFGGSLRPETDLRPGWNWLLPVTVGYDDLSGVDSGWIGALMPDQLVTLSVLPGVEYVVHMSPDWQLKPFVQFGGGRDFSIDEGFLLAQVGVRSLALFGLAHGWEVRWGNTVRWAAENQLGSGDRWGFAVLETGVDLQREAAFKVFGQPVTLGAYLIFQHMMPRWLASRAPDRRESIADLKEVGLSGRLAQGFDVAGIPFNSLRIGYKRGGGFRGWTIGSDFPF